ncbi:Opacity protein [Devosia lucknowensis]|uniref:Opacity protein n=1 Tax=Devosia lucknowensis TaxID=1096929 RepID=A0A1Y6ENI3_9HYPH|nr:porin family protein [Devosia lucknowensis]SMQ64208.1 Opacity protein [Devosia lucknowensis]
MFVRSLAIGVSAAALLVGGAQAADLIIPTTPQPVYEAAGFDWEGLYVGARLGGQFVGTQDYGVIAAGPASTYGVIGAAAGVNFIPVDPILLGVEVTADYMWNSAEAPTATGEFFANLRVGAVVTDNALIYAIGGLGFANTGAGSVGVYQLGGGVEFAVTDAITVRGEVVGQGDFSSVGADSFFESTKATVGVFYHF